MKRGNMVSWSALTPALSPRRGRILRSALGYPKPSVSRKLPPANHQGAVTDGLTIELLKTRDSCPLSLGERVRVRASVTTNFFPSINFLSPHNPRPRISRQRMRSTFLKRVENHITNKLFFAPQLRVPKADLPDAHRSEKLCALGVMRLLSGMPVVPSIKLDGKARLHAIKVEVVNPARMVAAEFVRAKSPVTQPTPHEFFCPCLFLPQCAGASGVGHGGKVIRVLRKEKNGVHDRPHPGPLPQERENRSPSSCVAILSSGLCDSHSELLERRDRQFDFRITKDARKLSPLPGGEGQGEGERHTNIPGNLVLTTALTPALSPRRGRIISRRSSWRTSFDSSATSAYTPNPETGGAA